MSREHTFPDQKAEGVPSHEDNNAPMLSIFASVFGLLLFFLLVINLLSESALRDRLDQSAGEGTYRLNWAGGGNGFVVISFPDSLRIVENGAGVSKSKVCNPESPFVSYARRVYERRNNQLIFVLLEGSVPVMSRARNCLMEIMPRRAINISWIMADDELLKSVALDDLPPYIEEQIKEP